MTVCTTKRLTLHYEGDLLGDGGDREPVVCLAGVAAGLVPPHLLEAEQPQLRHHAASTLPPSEDTMVGQCSLKVWKQFLNFSGSLHLQRPF